MAKNKRDTGGYTSSFDPNEIPIGENYFLGIGINSYSHFKHLNNAEKDVQDLAKVLTIQYTFEPANIDIIPSIGATRRNILKKLHEYQDKVSSKDKLLIYYAGHGYLNPKNKLGYWIPVDAAKDEVADLISNAEIQEIIRTYQAKHVLLISDSCFSASLLMRNAQVKDTSKHWEATNSRYIFTSGKEEVEDGEIGKNSPFAREIIDVLKSNQFEEINIGLLADQVTKNVGNDHDQKAEATPLFRSGHRGGQFIFYPRTHITGFQKALYLSEKNRKEEAVEELKRFLLNCQNLPEGYEYPLALLSNKIISLEQHKNTGIEIYFENIHKINTQLTSFLNHISDEEHPPLNDPRKIAIINLVAKNELFKALDIFLQHIFELEALNSEVYSIIACLNFLDRMALMGTISSHDLESNLEKHVMSIIFLLMRVDFKKKIYKSKHTIFHEFFKKKKLRYALSLCKEIIEHYSESADYLHLLAMLNDKHNNLYNKSISPRVLNFEIEKIFHALIYLLETIAQKSSNGKWWLESPTIFQILKDNLYKNEFNSLLKKGDLSNIFEKLPDNDLIYLFRSMYLQSEDDNRKALIETSNYIIMHEQILYKFYSSLFGDKSNWGFFKEFNSHSNPVTSISFFDVYTILCKGEVTTALNSLLQMQDQSEVYRNFIAWKTEFSSIQEDDFFTNKSKDLIFIRKNRIVLGIFQMLFSLEPGLFNTGSRHFTNHERVEIIELVSSGELDKALFKLNSYIIDSEEKITLSMITYQYNSMLNDKLLNIEQKHTRHNIIANVIIQILDSLTTPNPP